MHSEGAPMKAEDVDRSRVYIVRLSRAVTRLSGRVLKPLAVHEFDGAALILLIEREGEDIVDTAEPI